MPRVYINNIFQAPIHEKIFQNILAIFYKIAKVKQRLPLSLAIVGNREMQKINSAYRGIQAPTDVLSFSDADSDNNLPVGEKILGEIVISYPKAKQQAKKNNHSIENELCILFVHGLAHLAGYGHNNISEENAMKNLEKNVLKLVSKQIGVPIFYD